jgi:dipeptidyl aminopeptidase/acylaminoacyl peptidase
MRRTPRRIPIRHWSWPRNNAWRIFKARIEELQWSPDGKQIAYLAPDPKTPAEEGKEKDKDDARSIDRDDKRTHLWLLDVDSRKTWQVVGAPWRVSELHWSAHANRLIVVATDHPESDRETNRIFSISPADGEMQELAAPRGPFTDVRLSPEGNQLSYIAARRDGPAPHDLYVQSLGRAPRNLTAASIDRPVVFYPAPTYQWLSERELVVLVDDGFRSKLYAVTTDGRAALLAAPEMRVSGFNLTTATAGLLVGGNLDRPAELWEWNGRSEPRIVSHFNASFGDAGLLKPEFVHYVRITFLTKRSTGRTC